VLFWLASGGTNGSLRDYHSCMQLSITFCSATTGTLVVSSPLLLTSCLARQLHHVDYMNSVCIAVNDTCSKASCFVKL